MTSKQIPNIAAVKDWWQDARANPLFFKSIIGAILIAFIDQATKYWIVHQVKLPARRQIDLSGIFDLTYVQNKGASFGMLAGGMGSRILLSVISLGVALVMLGWLGRVKSPLVATAISFIIGGALGNLYDRVAYGYVIDFLDFSGLYFPWVFNIADTAINIGVGLLLIDAFINRRKPSEN